MENKKYIYILKKIIFKQEKNLHICLSLESNISSRAKIWCRQYTHSHHVNLFSGTNFLAGKDA